MDAVILKARIIPRPNTFKKLEEIRKLEKVQKGTGQGLGGTYGFVDPHFRFVHDYLNDWKLVLTPPNYRQFVGTSVTMEVSPEIFLPLDFQKYPKVLTVILMHEQKHVMDAEIIVRRLLPAALIKDATFKEYFLNRKPIPDGTYRYMLPNKVAGIVTYEFERLWSASIARQDNPAMYKALQIEIDKAQRESLK